MAAPFNPLIPATRYAARRLKKITQRIGAGKDGTVFRLSGNVAVKVHAYEHSFTQELSVYQRLREFNASNVAGFNIPRLLGFAEDLFAIEMNIVRPPYVLDFASAVLDRPYDFEEDVLEEWNHRLEEQFGEHLPDAYRIIDELGARFGVFLYDLHRHNIKFRGE